MGPLMKIDQFFKKKKKWKGKFIERLKGSKPQKKKNARIKNKKSHQGSFGASFYALLRNHRLYIFLLFLRPMVEIMAIDLETKL